ncbi:MAG: hypothetical protein ACJZ4G_02005 [Candidatus Pelagibacter sp.]
MNINIINKIIKHFTNPIQSIFFDVRKIYYIYSKFKLEKLMKTKLPVSDFLMDPDYIDLLNLYKIILQRKPKCTLEVGAGYSTIVILNALKKNAELDKEKIKFFSLEQDQGYLDKMKTYFNEEDLAVLKFVKINLIVKKINGQNVSICDEFPSIKINFFYEDRADHPKIPIAGDGVNIEEKMPEDFCLCVDGMNKTVRFFKENLKRDYKITGGIFSGTNFIPLVKK